MVSKSPCRGDIPLVAELGNPSPLNSPLAVRPGPHFFQLPLAAALGTPLDFPLIKKLANTLIRTPLDSEQVGTKLLSYTRTGAKSPIPGSQKRFPGDLWGPFWRFQRSE